MLIQALSHRSWCAENPDQLSNERLEFLGDSVLGLVVTEYLYSHRADLSEGEMTKIRAYVVSSQALSSIARELGLGESVLLGKGERVSGGAQKQSILADSIEAIFGALYLDAGWAVVKESILGLLQRDLLTEMERIPGSQDFKTRLQEQTIALGLGRPVYTCSEFGPDHAKSFTVTVKIGDEDMGTGEGRSKKQAEQLAAQIAQKKLINL